MSALVAVLIQEGIYDRSFVVDHTVGFAEIEALFGRIDVAEYAEICGVDADLIRTAARRIAAASSVAMTEDLGTQMNHHSTLVSWIEKLVWLLTGNFAKPGAQYTPSALAPVAKVDRNGVTPSSPVTGSRIVGGLIPCNVIPDEILTDHPDRFRALFVETANPAHSLADSVRMRQAIEALDLVVVLDVFMSETARLADYVLPVQTQFEKAEATFFNFEFPGNVFQLRRPVVVAPEGPLTEPEIHSRLVEVTGVLADVPIDALRSAAERSREEFAAAFLSLMMERSDLAALAPTILFRTLGASLEPGMASAAVLWAAAHRCVQANPAGCERAGYGQGLEAGERLFDAILASPSGLVFTEDDWEVCWDRLGTPDGRIRLVVEPLVSELSELESSDLPGPTDEWPFVLSAGERRSFTANTIIRDPGWRKRDAPGALRINPQDAADLGVETGGLLQVTTPNGSAVVTVELHHSLMRGHISLPNGMGLDHRDDGGDREVTGVAPNELTSSGHRDAWVGTPWHKCVPARLAAV
jgi:formate dehydrogenase